MRLIDSHAHLTAPPYAQSLEQILQCAREAQVDRWITIGTDIADSTAAIELCRRHKGVHCTMGVHPHEAQKQREDYIEQLQRLASTATVRAVGEIGLDYYYDFSERNCQKRVFEQQLTLAAVVGLPVVVHCRDAFDDCLAILDEWDAPEERVLFHCFTGDMEQAQAVLDRGYFVSFNGMITFANAGLIRHVAQYVPLERILLETDCPYLTPAPRRKIKPNEPAFLRYIAAELAQLRGVSEEKIAQATNDNCRLFFQLGEDD